MPIPASTTSDFPLTSDWLIVATDGDVIVSCSDPFNIAFTATTAAPDSLNRGHPTDSIWDGSYKYDARLGASEYLWARTRSGAANASVTATNPV